MRFGSEATDEARRAKEKACHALEMESEVIQREAAVEVKWKEIATSRRVLKQVMLRVEVLQAYTRVRLKAVVANFCQSVRWRRHAAL